VKKRLGLEAPSKLLVEQYLIEIAKNFNINYAGDNSIMLAAGQTSEELIQLREQFEGITKRNNNNNNNDGASGGGGGGGGGNLIHLDSPLFPQETKQVPIGFNEIDEAPVIILNNKILFQQN
jgi:vacuolar protein sorting-associated protein IST1